MGAGGGGGGGEGGGAVGSSWRATRAAASPTGRPSCGMVAARPRRRRTVARGSFMAAGAAGVAAGAA